MCNHLIHKFDGKTVWEAMLHNQKELAHIVAVLSEPEMQFVDFYKVTNETGREMADKLYDDVIVPTESKDTLLVIGGGELIMLLLIWFFG